jgi:hypothetical protein
MENVSWWIIGVGIVAVPIGIWCIVNIRSIGEGIERWRVSRALDYLERMAKKLEERQAKRKESP